jgi:endopeptidase La
MFKINRNLLFINKEMSECKQKITSIIEECGIMEIRDYITFLDVNLQQEPQYYDLLMFLNKMFHPTSCEKITTTSKYFHTYKLSEKTIPFCFPQKKIILSIIEHVRGCRIYIPCLNENYHILINGYFKKDMLNISRIDGFLKDKNHKIKDKVDNMNIPKTFIDGYIEQLSIRDFFVFTSNEIKGRIKRFYDELCSIREKPISVLVKDFLSKNIEKQRDMLTLLLLMKDDIEIQYLAYLMYDMISNESYLLKPQPLAECVYNSLHWSIQKIFKHTIKKISNFSNKQQGFQLENVSYDKRICLLKTTDKIKAKAFDKLKEIQNKNGDHSVKAEQYLDGLLHIPFGIYRRESILQLLNTIKKRSEDDIFYPFRAKHNIEHKTVSLQDVVKIIRECENNICETKFSFTKEITPYLKSIKIKDIKQDMKSKGGLYGIQEVESYSSLKKKDFITKIKQNWEQLSIDEKRTWCKLLQINISEEATIEEHRNLLYNWYDYKDKTKDYILQVRKTLDNAIYKQDKAKHEIERILAQWISGKDGGYCFGFEGPPGTGKTSLAKEGIAKCLVDKNGEKRPFAFIAVGGSANASTFEGHSYTYVGSTWGKIVDILMNAECMNPIIYIDELDKISSTEQGREIIGILTHLMDPSQNDQFTDKYFAGIPFDLSRVLFIFSYNNFSAIDPILADRIHRVKFEILSKREKIHIVQNYMLPELLNMVGFNKDALQFSDDILEWLIETYTCEAGVRKLKERIFEIVREYNLNIILGTEQVKETINVSKETIEKIFETHSKIEKTRIPLQPQIGIVNGLYATILGTGGLIMIEAYKTMSDQSMSLILTGQQGDVMRESMQCARTIAWNLLTMEQKMELRKEWSTDSWGIHIHCPEAATPKDGPSAGGAITLAIYSLLTSTPINNKIALTGEIDLNGSILKIGGLEHKIQGAIHAGVEKVLYPVDNQDDVDLIMKKYPDILDKISLQSIDSIHQILDIALLK